MISRSPNDPADAKVSVSSPFYPVIDEAYRVFACPPPPTTGVCEHCCMYPEIERDFFKPPIRELPLYYLRDWFFAACSPPLDKAVWQYLLPRVLEVLAAGEEPASVGLEVSLNRYPTGDRRCWTDDQWRVLERFRTLYLEDFARTGEAYLDDAVCMFGEAGWPLAALFEQMTGWSDTLLAERLWHDWCQYGRRSIWITAFWQQPGNTRAFEFYTSRELYQRMATFGLDEATPAALADKALEVADTIRENAAWTSHACSASPADEEAGKRRG